MHATLGDRSLQLQHILNAASQKGFGFHIYVYVDTHTNTHMRAYTYTLMTNYYAIFKCESILYECR